MENRLAEATRTKEASVERDLQRIDDAQNTLDFDDDPYLFAGGGTGIGDGRLLMLEIEARFVVCLPLSKKNLWPSQLAYQETNFGLESTIV